MMKKIVLPFLAMASLLMPVKAQTSMPLQNSSFEQWSSYPGYNISVMYFDLPVIDTFSYPTGWDYPLYHVDQSMSVMGMPIAINADIPLLKVDRDEGSVPDGNHGVRLETFMLEDLINPTVYSFAASSLDPMLTQTVFPSVLSTGTLNVNAFIPIMGTVISNMNNVLNLMAMMTQMDIDDYVTGGIALDGFEPTRLTGSYKYHSAVSGDNGGVLLLGTHYNTVTHKRELVGGGVDISLTDNNGYTPFTVYYMPLHAIQPSFPAQAPDSLIIMFISSANVDRQQGSYLCVDDLTLWHDTCTSVEELYVRNTVYDAFPMNQLEWSDDAQPEYWEVEYGVHGFEHGEGTVVMTTDNYFEIWSLEEDGVLAPNTWYDFYVRSVCNYGVYGEWDSVQYRTYCARVNSLTVLTDSLYVTANNLIAGYRATWTDTTDTHKWYAYHASTASYNPDMYYPGEYVNTTVYHLPPLRPNTQYFVSVTAECGEDNYGEEQWVIFNTATLGIEEANAAGLFVYPNPASGSCVISLSSGEPAELKLYDLEGRLVQTVQYSGTPVTMQLNTQGIYLLQATTSTGTVMRKIVNN